MPPGAVEMSGCQFIRMNAMVEVPERYASGKDFMRVVKVRVQSAHMRPTIGYTVELDQPQSRDTVGNPIMTQSEHEEATRLLNEKYRSIAAETQRAPSSGSEGHAIRALTGAEFFRSAEAKAPKDFRPKMIDQTAWSPSLSERDLEYFFYTFGPCVIVTVETDRKTERVTMAEVTAADENYGPTPNVVEATANQSAHSTIPGRAIGGFTPFFA